MKSYTMEFYADIKSLITDPVTVRGSSYAMIDTRILDGALDGSFVAQLMWRLDDTFLWRPFATPVSITAAAPYTTAPVDISCVHQVALRVTTVSGTAAKLAACITTDNIDSR